MVNKARFARITLSLTAAILFAVGASTALAQARLGPPAGGGSSYGSWQNLMGHYGIQYRLKCEDCSNPTGSEFMWWVEFHNGTGGKIAFDFRIAPVGRTNVKFSDRLVIDAGDTKEGWNTVDGYASPTVMTVYTDHWQYGANAQ